MTASGINNEQNGKLRTRGDKRKEWLFCKRLGICTGVRLKFCEPMDEKRIPNLQAERTYHRRKVRPCAPAFSSEAIPAKDHEEKQEKWAKNSFEHVCLLGCGLRCCNFAMVKLRADSQAGRFCTFCRFEARHGG